MNTKLSQTFVEVFDNFIIESIFWDDCKDIELPELIGYLHDPEYPNRLPEFKRDLAKACLESYVTLQEYVSWRGDNFTSQLAVDGFMQEIWRDVFGDEEIKV